MGFFDFFKKVEIRYVERPSKGKVVKQATTPIVIQKQMWSKVKCYTDEGCSAKTIVQHLKRDFPKSTFWKNDSEAILKAVSRAMKCDKSGKPYKASRKVRLAQRTPLDKKLEQARIAHKNGVNDTVCKMYADRKLCVPCNLEESPFVKGRSVTPEALKEWQDFSRDVTRYQYYGSDRDADKVNATLKKYATLEKVDDLKGSPFTNSGQIARTITDLKSKEMVEEYYDDLDKTQYEKVVEEETEKLIQARKDEIYQRAKEEAQKRCDEYFGEREQ